MYKLISSVFFSTIQKIKRSVKIKNINISYSIIITLEFINVYKETIMLITNQKCYFIPQMLFCYFYKKQKKKLLLEKKLTIKNILNNVYF